MWRCKLPQRTPVPFPVTDEISAQYLAMVVGEICVCRLKSSMRIGCWLTMIQKKTTDAARLCGRDRDSIVLLPLIACSISRASITCASEAPNSCIVRLVISSVLTAKALSQNGSCCLSTRGEKQRTFMACIICRPSTSKRSCSA